MNRVLFEETMEGISIERVTRDYNFEMPTKHIHDEYEIYYLLEGECYYFIENQTYLIKEGSIVFINKGQIHKTGYAGHPYHDRILISLEEEPFHTFLQSTCGISLEDFFTTHNGVFQLDSNHQSYVKDKLLNITEEMHQKNPMYQSMVMMQLCSVLIYIMRWAIQIKDDFKQLSALANTPKHRKVSEVASYIMANPSEAISLNNLAEHFYISKHYLSRIFKEVTGFTVSEYINIHRIKRAKELLLHTDYNISKVADLCGYESITYFERVFFKYTETSPLKYRNQYKKILQPVR